ncbi:UDP-N-acetylglucosamine 2-epimerase (hydrolysing) [Blastococcus sp. DSM 46786]|uniref:UDP-N-acetylglucosamine 2-epimerase n=1 Tax=Blastococcus sp. DSM 46786 TaxID=1798227 RepID=UPI0008C1A6A0|nr:UDP-N-acetylglucosamine 2-epimerase [Blastococcus sp. DSM 46786]SEK25589.1 UDP-N-acetylglucosamine 2-epimerase (hydrolysing) [Blastococcus sp. DSM 46786]
MTEPAPARRIIGITGTRADFGKMRDVFLGLQEAPDVEFSLVVTGMHLLHRYGYTVREIERAGLRHVHHVPNQVEDEPMALVLANSLNSIARLLLAESADMVLVHGDRVEALAGGLAGSLTNTRVAHVEGGEVSGTIDDSIRHSLTKQAHVHFVANEQACARVLQLGEDEDRIFVVGSPEADALAVAAASPLGPVRARYATPDPPYGIIAMHPVTTEAGTNRRQAEELVDAVLELGGSWVVIDPNNDEGTPDIRAALERLDGRPGIVRLPSMRFAAYLTLLRHAEVIIGNSSSGVREAPVLGTPAVDVGSRQNGRSPATSVQHVEARAGEIAAAVRRARSQGRTPAEEHFGSVGAAGRIVSLLRDDAVWGLPLQKRFVDR